MAGWIESRVLRDGTIRYRACSRDAAGRRTVKAFKLKRDAQAYLDSLGHVADLADPTLPARFLGKMWLDAYAADLTHRVRLGDVSPSTAAAYRSVLKRHLRPWLDGLRVDKLTPAAVARWARDLSERLDAGTLAPKTYNHVLGLFSAVCGFAVQRRWMRVSLADGLRRARVPRLERAILTTAQQRALLAAAPTPRLALVLRVALYAGLRRGELCGLQWGDLEAGPDARLTIARTVVGTVVRPPKTATSRRVIDVPASLVTAWQTERNRKEPNGTERNRTGWVLPSESDPSRPMHPDMLQAAVLPIFTKVGLPPSLHLLRHTYASLLIAQGEPAKYVSAQLGHASIQITLDTYGHLFADARRAAMDRLEAGLG